MAFGGMHVQHFTVPYTTGPQTYPLPWSPKAVLLFATSVKESDVTDGDCQFMLGIAGLASQRNYGHSFMLSDVRVTPNDVDVSADYITGPTDPAAVFFRITDQLNNPMVVADLIGFNESGITLNWTRVEPRGAFYGGMRVALVALGGDEVHASKLLTLDTPTVVGDQLVDFGFPPDVVLFALPLTIVKGATALADAMEAGSAASGFGVFDGGNQGYTATFHPTGSNPATSYRRTRTDRCIGLPSAVLATPTIEAEAVRFNADGKLLLQWHAVSGTSRKVHVLALRGPRAKVGSFAQPAANGNQAIAGVGFPPDALMVLSGSAVASTDSAADCAANLGFAVRAPLEWNLPFMFPSETPTLLSVSLADNAGTGVAATVFNPQRLLTMAGESSLDSTDPQISDIPTFDPDGFTVTWANADAVARLVIYLALGEKPTIPREFLDWPDKDVTVLAEITPSVQPSGWAVDGVHALTYTVAMPRFVQTSVLKGGVYRRVVGVRENATDLSACASAAMVNAHAGGWFWDEAAGVLYVRPTTNVDPDALDAIQVFTTFYVATRGVVLNGIYYHPWLVGLPSFLSVVEDHVFGVKASASGTLELLNGHTVFDTLVPSYDWQNKRVRLFVGGAYRGITLTREQYLALDTLIIKSLAANDERCVMAVTAPATELQVTVPPTPIFEAEYPRLADGVRGERKPIIYGRVTLRPLLVDTTLDTATPPAEVSRTYLVADAAKQTLYEVLGVWVVRRGSADGGKAERFALTPGVHYAVDLTACTVTLNDAAVLATYPSSQWDVEASVIGKPDGSGSYLKTAADIAKDLLVTFGGVSTADIDYRSFAVAARTFPYACALCLTEERPLRSVLHAGERRLASLERSCFGRIHPNRLGVWTFTIWSPQHDASALNLRASEIASLHVLPDERELAATVRVQYGQNLATGDWQNKTRTSARAQHVTESDISIDIFTFLDDEVGADLLARRFLALASRPQARLRLVETGTRLALHRAGDRVRIDYPRGQSREGKYESSCFELVSHARKADLEGESTLVNMGGFGDSVGVVGAVGGLSWASAIAEERRALLFVTDANGFIVPGDETTKFGKLLW